MIIQWLFNLMFNNMIDLPLSGLGFYVFTILDVITIYNPSFVICNIHCAISFITSGEIVSSI
jgi:hypothetical protein